MYDRGRTIGALIGGAFGTLFVWINSATFEFPTRTIVLVIAVAGFGVIIAQGVLNIRTWTTPVTAASSSRFKWHYWLIVGVEAVAIVSGSYVLTDQGYPELSIAWVAAVVGAHFFALAWALRFAQLHVLGATITACGLAGFLVRWCGQVEPIAIVSGVSPGFALLTFSLWASSPARRPVGAGEGDRTRSGTDGLD